MYNLIKKNVTDSLKAISMKHWILNATEKSHQQTKAMELLCQESVKFIIDETSQRGKVFWHNFYDIRLTRTCKSVGDFSKQQLLLMHFIDLMYKGEDWFMYTNLRWSFMYHLLFYTGV